MTKVLDHIQLKMIELQEMVETVRNIQKRQVILVNILQRKAGVTDAQIIEEEKRLHAKLKASSRNPQ